MGRLANRALRVAPLRTELSWVSWVPIIEGTPPPGCPADKRLCPSDIYSSSGLSVVAWPAVLEMKGPSVEIWGQIHRHCLKIYPKTSPNIMLG